MLLLACEQLSYRDKLRLAQLLIQTARKEEEIENPQKRTESQAKKTPPQIVEETEIDTISGNNVMRDMFYDGHPTLEKGAVVCRVAPSFIRFGSFQIHAAKQDIYGRSREVNAILATSC
jgi:hypothetical protein